MLKVYANALAFSLVFLFVGCKKEDSTPTPPAKSSEKVITEFKFLKSLNAELDVDYTGVISGTNITFSFPVSFKKESLIATFASSAKSSVTVGTAAQTSGQTPNSFTQPVVYIIKAEDGSTATYTVTLNNVGIAANNSINLTTSYYYELSNDKQINYDGQMPSSLKFYNGGYLARAMYDFDKDGDKDLMMGNLNFDDATGQLLNSPRPVNFIRNNGGVYADETASAFTGSVPGQVHPRKAIVGDFDKNGWMDVVFAGHGFDAPPFPGEQALVMMNNNGKFTSSLLPQGGFYHSVCSGDIDNDGDIDLFFTDNKNQCKFFLNDGKGQFTYDNTVFPSDIANLNYFTSELYDLNKDGYLDLVIAGHTHENATPTVLWGNYTGKYSKSRSSALPAVANWGVIIDINFIDINGDGLQDVVLNRQGDGTGSQQVFHGLYVQILFQESNKSFTDKTSTAITNNIILDYPGLSWFWVDWLRIFDVDGDGDLDITSDNSYLGISWLNRNGVFGLPIYTPRE